MQVNLFFPPMAASVFVSIVYDVQRYLAASARMVADVGVTNGVQLQLH
jgi:hypothetical protein